MDCELERMCKRVVVKNHSAAAVPEKLPWKEILTYPKHEKLAEPVELTWREVVACFRSGERTPFRITQNTWLLIGIGGLEDRVYETIDGRIKVHVYDHRLHIDVYGTRKERKKRKQRAIALIERQASAYYGAIARLQYKRGKNVFVLDIYEK